MATPNTFVNRMRRAVGLRPRGTIRITNWNRDERYVPRLPTGAYNLQGADLHNANLQGVNLEGANLSGANLEDIILSSANLQRANLTNANLQGANLQRTNLEGANLQGANLQRANLQRANLQRANLTNAILQGSNLRRANLEGANLLRTNFQGANLTNTILEGRNFPPPPAQAVTPAPPPNNVGAAYEIHNAFNKINKQELVAFFEPKIENTTQLANEFANMNAIAFLNMIKEKMDYFLSKLNPKELNIIPNKPQGYYPTGIRSWKHIWDAVYSERLSNIIYTHENKKIIGLSLAYVLKEPEQFQKNYVLCYLDEVAFAYKTGSEFNRNFSCSKGFVERFITCLKAGIEAELTTNLPEDKKTEYKMLLNIIQGGYDVEVAKQLINEWQNDNKNIITENGEFRTNKDELVTQQKDNLIYYLCCELGVTQEELMMQPQVRDTIEYMFSDDNILDNTLGGRKRKNRRTAKTIRKTKRKNSKKNKKRNTYKKV